MPLLVGGVAKVEKPKGRVARQLGGAGDVVGAVSLRVGEGQQFARAALNVGPYPPMNR